MALAAELEAVAEPEQTLVRCTITGEAAVDGEKMEEVAETTANRFLFGDFNREAFVVEAGGDKWVEDLPAGYIRKLGARLRKEAEADPIAAAALAELRREWREVRQ